MVLGGRTEPRPGHTDLSGRLHQQPIFDVRPHTDPLRPAGGSAPAPLTARTVHFAADYRGEQGAFFALKGLTGYYRGYFALLPYYEKVTQYSDIENRDIWEYELAFEPEQIG